MASKYDANKDIRSSIVVGKSAIKNKVLDLLEQVTNPDTGKGLFIEKRVVDIRADNNSCHIILNDNKLGQPQLVALKAQIIEKLRDIYPEQNISFETHSPSPSSSRAHEQNVAQLRAGHEKPQGQRRLDQVKKIIGIGSGKGGVGKSTIAANLALALKEEGFKVGVIDADIYGPSLPMIFGQRAARPTASGAKKIIPIKAFGIHLISFGFFVDEKDPVIWRGPMLGGVINQFLFDVEWPDLDYLLIDLPPGTGDTQLSLSQMIKLDGVVIVSTPQDIALLDAKKSLEMFRKVNVPILGMLQNMSYFIGDDGKKYYIFGENGVAHQTENLGVPFLGEIPLETALREGADSGNPYMGCESYRENIVWKKFMVIARKLVMA